MAQTQKQGIMENYQQKEHHRGIGFIPRTTY